ncbi:hypothetical protein [Nostoc sp. 'Peltigera membranacea cyanobiont' N6]|uniref:hypothetical protein n=1 Tax=Nostoc sp. 'Peltigera membranacea cyanobiont' N6 TaxID=1261031 RepID=UPI000CF32E41|nr:hypothetical protein [Nostoc sp. 'Peltigera membranacea cyanobiont' N6]AVH64173.1 hypothetical protein NPM_2508 [Nostoc sp. 'Peltigera membranacea cyanobiont' N6]
MNLKDIKEKLFPIIKVISIVAIASAIGLGMWNIQALASNNHLPIILNPVLIIAHLALSAHFVEAIIAACYAPAKNQKPIQYGIYTFFVGTIGLLELFETHSQIPYLSHKSESNP